MSPNVNPSFVYFVHFGIVNMIYETRSTSAKLPTALNNDIICFGVELQRAKSTKIRTGENTKKQIHISWGQNHCMGKESVRLRPNRFGKRWGYLEQNKLFISHISDTLYLCCVSRNCSLICIAQYMGNTRCIYLVFTQFYDYYCHYIFIIIIIIIDFGWKRKWRDIHRFCQFDCFLESYIQRNRLFISASFIYLYNLKFEIQITVFAIPSTSETDSHVQFADLNLDKYVHVE